MHGIIYQCKCELKLSDKRHIAPTTNRYRKIEYHRIHRVEKKRKMKWGKTDGKIVVRERK